MSDQEDNDVQDEQQQLEGPSSPDAPGSEDGPRSPSEGDDDNIEVEANVTQSKDEEVGRVVDDLDGPASPTEARDGEVDSDDEEIAKLEAEAADSDVEESKEDKQENEPASEDREEEDVKPQVDGKLIADIFGESDSEGEDFEGFKKDREEDLQNERQDQDDEEDQKTDVKEEVDSSEEDDDRPERSHRSELISDFDLMMQRKREENQRSRKRKNIDIINDSDDVIAEMISRMKTAADEDFENNKSRQPATNKLKLLPRIEDPLRKIDLREALLDSGILGVMTDWLTPLPDRSLPNVRVREVMLQVLQDFNISDTERLKASGIGKAVMYLYKHPKETKENKMKAHRLIQAWSRPIFNNDADFHSMTREDREQRDQELMSRSKRSRASEPSTPVKKGQEKGPQPGEKGWVNRARVPMPSARDYVNRPKPSPDVDTGGGRGSAKKVTSRLEQLQRSFMEKKKASKANRACKISIEGRKM